MRDLLIPANTPRVPREIRNRASSCLRHFPWDMDIERLAKRSPEIIQKERTLVKKPKK